MVSISTLVTVAATTSCSDDSSGNAPAGAGSGALPPLSEEAKRFVTDFCKLTGPCCTSVAGGDNTCATDTTTFGRGKTFDAASAAACLAALNTESKAPTFCAHGPDATVCSSVFKATAAKGPTAACKSNADCSSTADSDGLCLGAGDKARCFQVKRGKEGEDCVGTRGNGKTDELVKLPDSGALCYLADGLTCDATSRKCQRRGEVGATCSFSSLGSCVDSAWCGRTTSQCSARVAEGTACEDSDECAAGLACANDGSGSAVCVALAREGGACVRGDECDPAKGLVCDNNTTKCIVDTSVYGETCSGASAMAR